MVKKVIETSAKTFWEKNERIGLRKKVTETRAYRIDDADHYICLSLLLLRSILFYIVYLDDSALLQCRISEVIVIGIYSDQHRQSYMPLFQSLFFAILSSHFFPKTFLRLLFILGIRFNI